ncbi:MAG TPA: HU family DNA-binding protein [Paludibacter sp.]|nr:HU family DNA-binding protein [Paludibacter sp.]
MNKEKISSQEIIDLVASKAAVSKRAAEEFLKVMIATIEEALLAGDVVKIKNFGTFKLQWNEPRKSVNVQTGEEIILQGYHKVTFTPETSLKDIVNEPFAHLEPVQLDGENEFVIPEKKEEEALDPLRIFTEQASEIKDLLSEINALSPPPKRKENVINKDIVIKDYFDVEEHSAVEAEMIAPVEKVEIEEPEIETEIESEIKTEHPEIEVPEEPVFAVPEIEKEKVDIQETFEPVFEKESDSIFESTPFLKGLKPERKRKRWLWVGVVTLLLAVCVGLYMFFPPANKLGNSAFELTKNEISYVKNVSIPRLLNSVKKFFSPELRKVPVTETVVIPKDTVVADTDTVEVQEPVDSLQLLFDNPRVYTQFIASEQINAGSRLTIMSKKYYGTKDFWVYIYEANKERIQNPDNIEMGTLIRIPKLDSRLIDASNPRCIQKALELHDEYVKKKSSKSDSSD